MSLLSSVTKPSDTKAMLYLNSFKHDKDKVDKHPAKKEQADDELNVNKPKSRPTLLLTSSIRTNKEQTQQHYTCPTRRDSPERSRDHMTESDQVMYRQMTATDSPAKLNHSINQRNNLLGRSLV